MKRCMSHKERATLFEKSDSSCVSSGMQIFFTKNIDIMSECVYNKEK